MKVIINGRNKRDDRSRISFTPDHETIGEVAMPEMALHVLKRMESALNSLADSTNLEVEIENLQYGQKKITCQNGRYEVIFLSIGTPYGDNPADRNILPIPVSLLSTPIHRIFQNLPFLQDLPKQIFGIGAIFFNRYSEKNQKWEELSITPSHPLAYDDPNRIITQADLGTWGEFTQIPNC